MKKQNQVIQSKTPKVYKSKKLNNANFCDYTLNSYQIFKHIVTKLGGVNEFGKYLQPKKLQREHTLTAIEFSNIFGIKPQPAYTSLKKACKTLMKTSVIFDKPEQNSKKEINVCSSAEYFDNEGKIVVKFTDDIMPYLSQAKREFILYNLKEIANFGSLYTTRLYELIVEFKTTGWIHKTVDELRHIFAVGTKHKEYRDFKRHTIKHAVKEINNNYSGLDLTFEEIKNGRKVIAVKFLFNKKGSNDKYLDLTSTKQQSLF